MIFSSSLFVTQEPYNLICITAHSTGITWRNALYCNRLAHLRPAPHLAFTSDKAFIRYKKYVNLELNMMFSPITITVLLRNDNI